LNRQQRIDERLLIDIKNYIQEYQADWGRSPSMLTIAEHFRTNTKRVHKYVGRLTDSGVIDRDDRGRIQTPSNIDPDYYNPVPKVGLIACGKPTLAVEDYDGIFRLPREFTGSGEFFMLEAEGDSMIDANIFEGDLLVIRRQETANFGDIVVAVKESEYGCEDCDATLKRYKIKNGKPILHAENEERQDEYPDMDARKFRIIGKLKSLIRDME